MPSSVNEFGIKNFRNVWIVSGTPVMIVPNVQRTYAEIFNEGPVAVRMGGPSGTVTASMGMLLPSGTYISDPFSSDEWWAFSTSGGSGSVSSFWVEGV